MEWPPTARLDVVQVATPCVSGTEANRVCPSRKLTDPLGVLTVEETVAVKVTAFVTSTKLCEDTSVTVGLALPTIKETLALTDW